MNLRLTNRPRPRAATLAAAALFTLGAVPAAAQDNHDGQPEGGYIVTVGIGAQTYPEFPGAEDLGVFPFPIVGIRRAGRPIPLEAPDEGFGFGLLGENSPVNVGPAVNFQRRRRAEDVGAAVDNVGFTVEAGGFVEAMLGENFRLRGEIRQGIGGHEGLVADLGADLFARGRGDTVFSIGPRIRWADNDYMDAYYGVTPVVAGRTGLPVFDARSGIHAIGGAAGLRLDVGSGFAIHGYARYDRLMDDAADSPI
ncbi:MAG TPA: MipA/OmpV family protein, partial [Allosphingosinicella sp.]|nr:MipA/OmpV family protein [Allosphingosinicella sp.]